MIDKELLKKLDQWHEDNHHKEIIQEIEALPEEQRRDYELQGHLARALNNIGRYQEAMAVLEAVRQEGEQDSRWWSRIGYAFFHLDRLQEAQECFLTAQRIDPKNEDAKIFLAWLNVSPSGRTNAWSGSAARKKGEQTGTANGWSGGKGPAGKRPKGDGGASDWGGRGWEGTAQIETLLFGSLHFPVKEGLFETMAVTIDGEKLVTNLFIWDNLARPERWEAIGRLLDRLPEMYRKARERMNADLEENEVIRFFIRDQLAELEEEPLLRSLQVASREEATPERFLRALSLRGVAVAPRPGAEEEMDCTLDFCLDPEITDQLLVFRFTPEAELYDISHES